MRRGIDGSMFDRGTCRVCAQKIVVLPVSGRPDWPADKSAAAVRADVMQDVLDTGCAKGALIGTDAPVRRLGRQRFIAVFASWSKFQHDGLSMTK